MSEEQVVKSDLSWRAEITEERWSIFKKFELEIDDAEKHYFEYFMTWLTEDESTDSRAIINGYSRFKKRKNLTLTNFSIDLLTPVI